MEQINMQKMMNAEAVFSHRFLNTKSLYLYCFQSLPSIHFMNRINGEKACAAFREAFATLIVAEHKYCWFDRKKNSYEFDESVFVLGNDCLIEFGETYCEILHNGRVSDFLLTCTTLITQYRKREKRKPLELNLVVRNGTRLETRSMDLRKIKLDLDLYYEDDFKEVDVLILKKLNKKGGRGIVLLHGLPGTGKTSYLRYLIGRVRKRVLFLSPAAASGLTDPDFIDLLVDNPDTVLVIEDAEAVLRDRRRDGSSAVSHLLNISDGLISDFLNVQLICTFNSPLALIDPALLRKGRLIARYEFGKLSREKAERLNARLGRERTIERAMTLAEVINGHEKNFEEETTAIGFQRAGH